MIETTDTNLKKSLLASNTRKVFGFRVLGAVLFVGLFTWVLYWCGFSILRQPNALAMSVALLRLSKQPSKDAVVSVFPLENVWIQKSMDVRNDQTQSESDDDPIGQMLKGKGWHFRDQHGSMRFFGSPKNCITLTCDRYNAEAEVCIGQIDP